MVCNRYLCHDICILTVGNSDIYKDSILDTLIKKYFTAWETKNDTLLEEVLTPNFKGIRTFFEEKLYDLDQVLFVLNNPRKLKYEILKSDHYKTFSYVDAYLYVNDENEELITLKISYENGLIDSVYETHRLIGKKRIKCICSYDGSMFIGYQKQPSKKTVQDAIEEALFRITKEKILIHSSGRTDRGVHAYNQVFHFDTESSIHPEKFKDVLNSYLSEGIFIKDSEEVHETFHSRYDISSKQYVYKINKNEYDVILRNYEYYPGDIDFELLKSELKSIEGTHDFTSLTKTNTLDNTRTIFKIEFVENDHYLYVYITGNGFLRYMVRNIIATAITISKKRTQYTLLQIIKKKDNTLIKDIAPSGGLYMNKVTYYD